MQYNYHEIKFSFNKYFQDYPEPYKTIEKHNYQFNFK